MINTGYGTLKYNEKVNNKILELCQPLFETFGFTYFNYIKLMPNKKRMYLSSSLDWVRFYIEHNMQNDKKHEECVIVPSLKRKNVLWSSYEADEVFKAVNNLGIYNGLYIYENNEIFSFATKVDNRDIINSYVSNIDLLNHFILFFKNKGRNIIFDQEAEKILLSSKFDKRIIESTYDNKIKEFYKSMKLNKFCLVHQSKEIWLSRREVECLIYLSRGNSMSRVAQLMKISIRTIESYIDNIKKKLQCFSRQHVMDVFLGSSLKNITIDNLYIE